MSRWVNGDRFAVATPCPLFPPKATGSLRLAKDQQPPPAPQQFRVALMESCQRDVPKSRLLRWAVQVLSGASQRHVHILAFALAARAAAKVARILTNT